MEQVALFWELMGININEEKQNCTLVSLGNITNIIGHHTLLAA
jgi:hypothetical protein